MIRLVGFLFILLNCSQQSACFIPSWSSPAIVCQRSSLHDKPGWLDDAMEGFTPKEEPLESRNVLPLTKGLAGFSIDEKLGFSAILASPEEFVPVQIAPQDKDKVSAPESLTLVQLAGGLDLGTTILPPDILARYVVDKLNSMEEDDNPSGKWKIPDVRPCISITKIEACPNSNVDLEAETFLRSTVDSSPLRDKAIEEYMPKLWAAVKGLPGCREATESQVLDAVQIHAHPETGEVDRVAFAEVLQTLRQQNALPASPNVMFLLSVQLLSGESVRSLSIETYNPMHALGLSMRYTVPVEMDSSKFQTSKLPAEKILDRFPAFRPMQELLQDAKVMDGFIPGMFEKAKLDNDMKE